MYAASDSINVRLWPSSPNDKRDFARHVAAPPKPYPTGRVYRLWCVGSMASVVRHLAVVLRSCRNLVGQRAGMGICAVVVALVEFRESA